MNQWCLVTNTSIYDQSEVCEVPFQALVCRDVVTQQCLHDDLVAFWDMDIDQLFEAMPAFPWQTSPRHCSCTLLVNITCAHFLVHTVVCVYQFTVSVCVLTTGISHNQHITLMKIYSHKNGMQLRIMSVQRKA